MPRKQMPGELMIDRPAASEYAPYYALYVDQVPEGDILDLMEGELAITLACLESVPQELENHRYAPDKWSLREAVGHIVDVERTFGYRAVWFARLDPSPLPSMDQDLWAGNSNASERSLESLAAEFALARRGHIAMFRGLGPSAFLRRGVASDCEFSVRSLPFILVGHEIHHRRVITERYLGRG
jgi:hypothetical protein